MDPDADATSGTTAQTRASSSPDAPYPAAVTALASADTRVGGPSASTSTQQQPQPERRRASFFPPALALTSTSHHWSAGGGGGFGVFPAASCVSASVSASYFSTPSASGSSSEVHLPGSSGSFPSLCILRSRPRRRRRLSADTRPFSSPPGSTSGSASCFSSSASSFSSGRPTSSFTSSGGSATPVPVVSWAPATSGARAR
ncbi:hypothetical protein C8R44DRAFT_813952 [Mycena epipterygia]|nr:hypothetical protein C8R44DRAFT_813952 [Mycena epipterygia]